VTVGQKKREGGYLIKRAAEKEGPTGHKSRVGRSTGWLQQKLGGRTCKRMSSWAWGKRTLPRNFRTKFNGGNASRGVNRVEGSAVLGRCEIKRVSHWEGETRKSPERGRKPEKRITGISEDATKSNAHIINRDDGILQVSEEHRRVCRLARRQGNGSRAQEMTTRTKGQRPDRGVKVETGQRKGKREQQRNKVSGEGN